MVAEGGFFPPILIRSMPSGLSGFLCMERLFLFCREQLCCYVFTIFRCHVSPFVYLLFFVNGLCGSSPIDNLPKRIDLTNNRAASGTNSDNF